ncbi:MAG: CotH kinase family protein, partial [Bacteroidota bacterium]
DLKYKGNSTYRSNRVKNPWHIELDTYKDHEYAGYTDIKLANGYNDPSFLRDVLGYQILRQYMEAPQANFANLFVNGVRIGLYANTESISKKFVNKRFGSNDHTFFKCSPPDGAGPQANDLPNLVYLGQDSAAYEDAYELKSDYGWQELIDLCDTLANHIGDIEKILDVDKALWMLAFNNVVVNLDSYIGAFKQNYYLYRDDYGRFLPVVWDLNESFGVFSQTGTTNLSATIFKQQMTHLLHANDSDFPLVQKLLSVPMYKRMYLAHIKTMLEENFDNNSYYNTGLNLQNVISASVQADGNKFFTYNNFISNLNTDVSSGGPGPGGGAKPGLTNLMDARSAYLLGHTDFTQTEPGISQISLSNAQPVIYETVTITATISDANAAYLGHRLGSAGPFTRVQMYDDGAHNDGVANDGVYGADVTLTGSLVQYYLYAENSDIGRFSPQRAEHEFHTLRTSVVSQATGELVINEFMASNDHTVADQDGEYDDWIELYNNGSSSLNLEGFYLSDDSTDLFQWAFPAGTVIEANDYLVIWADDDENQTGLHANFKLSAGGEAIFLVDTSSAIIDQLSYESQTTDISYGRFPNGTGNFQTMTATFSGENVGTTTNLDPDLGTLVLSAYPNPVDDAFYVEIAGGGQKERSVSVYTLNGRRCYEGTLIDRVQIDVSGWTAGMYFVKVENAFLKIMVN